MLQLTRDVIEWIKDYYSDNPEGKAIIGISGGKDSTICAALLVEALGKDRVIGVLMPNGKQDDIHHSYRVCGDLGIQHLEINIGAAYNNLAYKVMDCEDLPDMIKTNLPSRLRMATLYAVAALYPNSRVVNTSNYSERFVGYSTKFGDGVGDFSPLGNLTMTHVLAIGDDLGLPYELVHKEPSDGMSGKTDEDNLGFTYKDLDNYLFFGRSMVSKEVEKKIVARHWANMHKLEDMPRFTPVMSELVQAKKGNGGI
jgi:NAD+ synthase